MNRYSAAALSFALSLTGVAATAAPRDPSGVWITEDGRARVRVEKCGSARENLCGYIIWLKAGTSVATTDVKNPDSRKARRAVLGHQLILGLKPNDEDHYEGLIYNADDGKTYDVDVWLAAASDLKVKGCLLGFLCGTQSWKRANDVVPGQLTGPTGGSGGPTPDPEWAVKPSSASAAPAAPRRDPQARP